MDPFVLLPVGWLGLGVLVGYLIKRLPTPWERHDPFAALAIEHGFTYFAYHNAPARRWSGTPFGIGDARVGRNVLTGVHKGHRFIAFNYYADAEGPISTSRKYSVVVIRLPRRLPSLEVVPWTPAPVPGALRFELGVFNERFHVTTSDPRFGHAVIHPRMMHLLLTHGGISWRFEDDAIIGWTGGSHGPEVAMYRLEFLCQVANLIPGFVWRDYGGDPMPR